MNTKQLLNLAAQISRHKIDNRNFCLGAVGIRSDKAMVRAYNGSTDHPNPLIHCEARLVRKLDKGAVVFLARTTADGQWANSKPCNDCLRAMKRVRVSRLYYTLAPDRWDTIEFN